MAKLDLDARRAAATMTPHELTLGGLTYRLKARLPLEFTELLNEGKLTEALQMLLLDPSEWEQMRAAFPDLGDLEAIIEQLYGTTEGESAASGDSSANGGTSSRPTSDTTTTGSTSAKPAGGRKR